MPDDRRRDVLESACLCQDYLHACDEGDARLMTVGVSTHEQLFISTYGQLFGGSHLMTVRVYQLILPVFFPELIVCNRK